MTDFLKQGWKRTRQQLAALLPERDPRRGYPRVRFHIHTTVAS